MDPEFFREYCLKKPGVTEELPFGPDTLVFKVMGKLFALTGIGDVPGSCNLKCDPDYAEELREKYPAITPGYHMNKKHWNTVILDGSIPDKLILDLTDHSYDLVVSALPIKSRENLKKKSESKKRKNNPA